MEINKDADSAFVALKKLMNVVPAKVATWKSTKMPTARLSR